MIAPATGARRLPLSDGETVEVILGSFDSKLQPFFALASFVLEAEGNVPASALPISADLARSILDLRSEWEVTHQATLDHLTLRGARRRSPR